MWICFVFICLCHAGNAQAAEPDTLQCVRAGGSCNFGECRPPSVASGTCKGETLNCCKW
uniref:Beta-defensin-like domain-containing protein n=1 Tax=Varanus komodoensis TaxID=61221 RepID=A0A8D2IZM7_VARKO